MTEKQFLQKVKSLIASNEIRKFILKKAERVVKSGCMNLEAYENNYILAKCFIHAAFKELAWQNKPISKEGQKESANIEHFI